MDAGVLNDTYLSALCVWREMRGESPDARLACYWVIRNRANDPRTRWPRTYAGVVTQKYQFSSFNSADPNSAKWPDMRGNSEDYQAWVDIVELVGEPGPDNTDGANAYEAVPDGQTKPGWAEQGRLVKVIGKTRFYKL